MTITLSQSALEAQASITLAVLGCGKLGTAVLQGLLSKSEVDTDPPTPLVSRVLATVRSTSSAQSIQQKLQSVLPSPSKSHGSDQHPEIVVLLQEENARAVREADIVILGCKSNSVQDILGKPDVRSALLEHECKKILVSLLGGVATTQLKQLLHSSSNTTQSAGQVVEERCEVVRAIPNIAARFKQSMTVLSLPSSKPGPTANNTANTRNPSGADLLTAEHSLIGNLFEHIGATEWLPEALMDNGASLCAATPALFATLIEAIATSDGAVAIDTYGGTLENHALRMAAYAARGTADLLLAGQQPEEIRKDVATEGGATRQGLNALDQMKVAEALRKSMTEIFTAAGTLGERD